MSVILHDLTPTDPIPVVPAAEPGCPSWCRSHDITPESDGTTFVVHRGTVVPDAAGYHVALWQGEHVEPDGRREPGPVDVVLDGDAVSVEDARRLIAAVALATELAAGGAR